MYFAVFVFLAHRMVWRAADTDVSNRPEATCVCVLGHFSLLRLFVTPLTVAPTAL